jgi:hypothetical protein
VDQDLKLRIESAVARTGVDEATLVRNCIEALCDHVERHGQITFPLCLDANHVVPGRYPKTIVRHEAIHDKPAPKTKPPSP